jgi:hypothetical protein
LLRFIFLNILQYLISKWIVQPYSVHLCSIIYIFKGCNKCFSAVLLRLSMFVLVQLRDGRSIGHILHIENKTYWNVANNLWAQNFKSTVKTPSSAKRLLCWQGLAAIPGTPRANIFRITPQKVDLNETRCRQRTASDLQGMIREAYY